MKQLHIKNFINLMESKIIINHFNIYLGDNDLLSISCVISNTINNFAMKFYKKNCVLGYQGDNSVRE